MWLGGGGGSRGCCSRKRLPWRGQEQECLATREMARRPVPESGHRARPQMDCKAVTGATLSVALSLLVRFEHHPRSPWIAPEKNRQCCRCELGTERPAWSLRTAGFAIRPDEGEERLTRGESASRLPPSASFCSRSGVERASTVPADRNARRKCQRNDRGPNQPIR